MYCSLRTTLRAIVLVVLMAFVYNIGIALRENIAFQEITEARKVMELQAIRELAVKSFITGRDNYIRIHDQTCLNCYLNKECFNSDNLWYPMRCGANAKDYYLEDALPILFIGDSRVRNLFTATVQVLYGEDAAVLRQEGLKSKVKDFELSLLKLPNWKVERGLQANFRVDIDQIGGDPVTHIKFIWSPMLDLSPEMLLKELHNIQPRAVIFSAGIWFLAEPLNNHVFTQNLRDFLNTLTQYTKESQSKLVYYLQPESIKYNHGKYSEQDLLELNQLVQQIKESSFPELIIWDSHLQLEAAYIDLCRSHPDLPEDEQGLFMCTNDNHSGFIVINQLARWIIHQLLLWTKTQ